MKNRHVILIITLVMVVWPTLMSIARGYCNVSTVLGDAMVAALGLICTGAAVAWLQEKKDDDSTRS